jgi:hypothetical protein
MSKTMNAEEKKLYDFTKVRIEVEIDVFQEIDASKQIGNIIHQNTTDIGIDDIAREIYHKGEVELSEQEAQQIKQILLESPIIVGAKRALQKLLEG